MIQEPYTFQKFYFILVNLKIIIKIFRNFHKFLEKKNRYFQKEKINSTFLTLKKKTNLSKHKTTKNSVLFVTLNESHVSIEDFSYFIFFKQGYNFFQIQHSHQAEQAWVSSFCLMDSYSNSSFLQILKSLKILEKLELE